ncbi:hypothetical protein ALP32_102427 [Pseudomonas avellanae]|uniref:Uncharacterized protein n=1 Tax=Pseudomonas avellanae TaxID=46257 RepID=A0A3M5STD0_9PSED|nr:hypothetical protein ALP32_102427 [Pseudomonas avellanae]
MFGDYQSEPEVVSSETDTQGLASVMRYKGLSAIV